MQIEEIIENVHQAVERGCTRVLINTESRFDREYVLKGLYLSFSEYTDVKVEQAISRIKLFNNTVQVMVVSNTTREDCYNLSGATYDYVLDIVPPDVNGDYVHRRAFLINRMQHIKGVVKYYETDYEKTFIK